MAKLAFHFCMASFLNAVDDVLHVISVSARYHKWQKIQFYLSSTRFTRLAIVLYHHISDTILMFLQMKTFL